MADPRLDDPGWLRGAYHERGMTLEEIGEECGVAKTTVWKRMRKYGVKTGVDDRLNDEPWLRQMYQEEGMSLNEIAEECGCSHSTVRRRLSRYGINTRPQGSGGHNEDPLWADELIPVIEGELLGDGSLIMQDASTHPFFSYGVQYEAHRDWLASILEAGGMGLSTGHTERPEENWGDEEHYMHTHCYPFLGEQYERWYGGGEKRVPGDLELTPTVMLHWFIGDGGISQRDKNGYLHTQSFTEQGVSDLVGLLRSEGVGASLRTDQDGDPQIFVPTDAMHDLWDYAPSCPPELEGCYGHKWP